MEKKNYDELTNSFFDEMEETVKSYRTKKKIVSFLMLLFVVGLFALAYVVDNFDVPTFVEFCAAGCIPAFIICMFIHKRFRKQLKNVVKEMEHSFYDKVYFKVVASELDAEGTSVSITDYENKPYAGQIIEGKYVTLNGKHNGSAYTISCRKEKIVESVTVHEATGKAVFKETLEHYSPTALEYKSKNTLPKKITLSKKLNEKGSVIKGLKKMFSSKPDAAYVNIDNNNFEYDVTCEDEIEAYKFLTAGCMEKISQWNSQQNISRIEFENDMIKSESYNRIIDLDYLPAFSKNTERNRKKYTGESVVRDAQKTISNVKQYLEAAPFVINN